MAIEVFHSLIVMGRSTVSRQKSAEITLAG
jgi:hypothetical protein